ncbi:unnamed protein product [Orchesella dallaii]|uniref:Transcription factor Iwr1 domain-containing protein n=1 Tax=Orchesella dallaii TaxID=48710 RepID=A0ABP1QL60_9HEXA
MYSVFRNRFGNNSPLCPLFCCFFMGKCGCLEIDDDDLDMRRPILKRSFFKSNKYVYKRTKPRDINKRRKSLLTDPSISPSPVIHSGLRRLPFNGTLSDLTERSEEESLATASTTVDDDKSIAVSAFQFDEPSLVISGEEEISEVTRAINTTRTASFTYPVENEDVEDIQDEDYPSDTHGGAVKAFSQLVSDDSESSAALLYYIEMDHHDKDTTHAEADEENHNSDLKLEGFDDPEDSESLETQYLIEEIYGYAYDEAVDDDDDDSDERK